MQKILVWISLKANPISFGYKNYQQKIQISKCAGSAVAKTLFFDEIYKGFPKFIKEKYFRMNFQILPFKFIV